MEAERGDLEGESPRGAAASPLEAMAAVDSGEGFTTGLIWMQWLGLGFEVSRLVAGW